MRKYILLLLFGFSSLLHAEDSFDLVLSAGLTSGGETLARTTTGGSLKTGGLILFQIGGVYTFEESNFQIQSSVGYHFDELNATNGSADFDRTTFELIPFFRITETTRIGIGYISAQSPEYTDPIGGIEFEDADGYVVEIDWMLSGSSWFGIRYADLEYVASKIDGVDVSTIGTPVPIDGSYAGVIFHAGF